MNINKLKKAIVKEFKRSPAKSVVLLLLCPVALYFIAPLFKGVLPNSTKAPALLAQSDTTPFGLPLATPEPTQLEAAVTNWREIAEWMERDQLSQPAHAFAAVRSPFADPAEPDPSIETEATDEEDEERRPVTVRDIFNDGHLTLSVTMLGTQRRMATINGQVFTEGDIVPVALETGVGGRKLFKLNLARVERRAAVLTYNEETFQIELQDRIPADAIIVRRAGQ